LFLSLKFKILIHQSAHWAHSSSNWKLDVIKCYIYLGKQVQRQQLLMRIGNRRPIDGKNTFFSKSSEPKIIHNFGDNCVNRLDIWDKLRELFGHKHMRNTSGRNNSSYKKATKWKSDGNRWNTIEIVEAWNGCTQ